jgi:hypothetical protein
MNKDIFPSPPQGDGGASLPPQSGTIGGRKKRPINFTFAGVGILLCLYLVWPAFHAVQLEGFTAQTESLAILASRAPGAEHDPYLPVVSQFIYQTRSTVVDALKVIYDFFPGAGDTAFQALVMASFILLVIASVLFARRWGKLNPIFPIFALALTPGIPETAFFFNDNIVSAAFAAAALACIPERRRPIVWWVSGFLMVVAISSRADAVFMLPMLIGVVFYNYDKPGDRFAACLAVCLSMGIFLSLNAVYHGFSLIDVFFTAKRFVITIEDKYRWFWVRTLFIGLSALPLLVIGILISYRRLKARRSYIGILTFIAYPVLLAIFAPKATEVRYIFPLLAPMVALHVGTGIQWVYNQCVERNGKNYHFALGLIAYAFVTAVLPPTFIRMADGPRLILGRLWSPISWRDWQSAVDESVKRSNTLVAALDNQQLNLVIATHYNDEFYLRLRLIEAGFTPMLTEEAYPGCKGFSLLKKGASTVAQVRTDPQYRIAPVTIPYNAALQISSAISCQRIQSFSHAYISTFGINREGIPKEIYGMSPLSFPPPLNVVFHDIRSRLSPDRPELIRDYGLIGFRELANNELLTINSNAETYIRSHPEYDPATGKPVTIEDYENYYRPSIGPTSALLKRLGRQQAIGNDR